jgi:hypothetical protein
MSEPETGSSLDIHGNGRTALAFLETGRTGGINTVSVLPFWNYL